MTDNRTVTVTQNPPGVSDVVIVIIILPGRSQSSSEMQKEV